MSTIQEEEQWEMTVVYGKETTVVAYDPHALDNSVAQMKEQLEQRFGVPVKYQKLIFRGKELKDKESKTLALVNGGKVMLLLNQLYHKEKPALLSTASKPSSSTLSGVESIDNPLSAESTSAIVPPTQPRVIIAPIDVDSLDDDTVIVQVFRGKISYEFIFSLDSQIMDVKERLSGVLGVSISALRLVIKGKTPNDNATLNELPQKARTIKCMVLFQAQQHILMEKENEFRLLMNELTQLQVTMKKLEKQVARNFLAREEALIQLSALLDGVQHVRDNLQLLQEYLQSKSANKPRSNTETSNALSKAIEDANLLVQFAQSTLERFPIS